MTVIIQDITHPNTVIGNPTPDGGVYSENTPDNVLLLTSNNNTALLQIGGGATFISSGTNNILQTSGGGSEQFQNIGTNTTDNIDARNPTTNTTWDTILFAHSGDTLNILGFNAGTGSNFKIVDGVGAPGQQTGATIQVAGVVGPGGATNSVNVTFAGITAAQLAAATTTTTPMVSGIPSLTVHFT